MMLRSRTTSNGNLRDGRRSRNISHGSIDSDYSYSSPVLRDVGNLAPEQLLQQAEQVQPPEQLRLPEQEARRKSGSSSSLSGMSEFLAKYEKPEETGSDDETVDENASQFESSEVDAQRRKQQLEEHNSAVLSKRAEQILANAKKRLNVMEGNLRGARDLVAPLTAANLKRATSLGSAHTNYSQGASYNSRVRYIPQQQHYNRQDRDAEQDEQPVAYRILHSQASTPALGRQYQHQHTRNFSEINLPDRPFTSMDQRCSRTPVQPRSITPSRTRASESPTHTPGLRASRSYDSLGMGGRERPLHTPDINHLEALPEDDEVMRDEANWRDAVKQRYCHQPSVSQDTNNGLGIYRPSSRSSSRTSSLREQMSSLKGRISTLKHRAREDSLRRQSQANLRAAETTPFNNAESAAPELFYSPGCGNVNEFDNAPPEDVLKPDPWITTGSRNAFAEQAKNGQKNHIQCARVVEISAPQRKVKVREIRTTPSPPQEIGRKRSGTTSEMGHQRTSSGTAIVRAADKRYSHHQLSSSGNSKPGLIRDDIDVEDILAAPPSPPLSNDGFSSSLLLPDHVSKTDSSIDDDYAPSESDGGDSVYEDAPEYEGEAVVPHEHREDAFDYEEFFLTGAMARYNGQRRGSESSMGSMSSTETARGPTVQADEMEADYGYSSDPETVGIFPPATPQTPERLRAIERGFVERHIPIRPLSEESIGTVNSYATAREGSGSLSSGSDDDDDSPPVSPISEALKPFSTPLDLPERPVSPLTETGRDAFVMGRYSTFMSRAEGGKKSSPVVDDAARSPRAIHTDSTDANGANRPRTAVRMRRSSSSDRADSGIGSETKSSARGFHQSSSTHRPGQPSRDLTSVAVDALLDPRGVALGLRDNAVLFGVVESLRNVVKELQRKEEDADGKNGTSREMRMLMMRRRLERARGALDGGFGGV